MGVWLFAIGLAFMSEQVSQGGEENWATFLQSEWSATALANIALVTALLMLTVAFLTRLLSVGVGLVGAGVFILHLVNAFKVTFRNEPFYPWDFSLAGETGNILSDINLQFTDPMIYGMIYLLVGILGAVVLDIFVLKRIRMRYYKEAILGGITLLFCVLCFNQRFSLDYLKENEVQVVTWEPLKSYQKNGFIYSFIRSFHDAQVSEPQGYSEEAVTALTDAAAQKAKESGAQKEPNIIVIMSEAFMDLERAENLTFERELTPRFNALSKQYLSGRVMTSEYGGGTANSEFEVLTGYSTYGLPAGSIAYASYVNGEVGNYVSYLNERNYNTVALHPYQRSFFSREKAYEVLGFDAFYSEEHFTDAERIRNMSYVSDMALTERIIAEYEASAQKGEPFFCHAVSMQNHASYDPNEFGDQTIHMESTAELSDYDRTAIETYATGISKTDEALGALVDYFEAVEEPTVVIFFGDHQPYFSATVGLAEAIGYESGTDAEKAFYRHSTPYLIWNNFEEQPTHAEADFSMYQLLSYATEKLGMIRPAYYYYLDEFRAEIAGATRQVTLLPNGEKIVGMTEEAKKQFDAYWMVTYDLLLGKEYLKDLY